jgi:CBS domain-containing protein
MGEHDIQAASSADAQRAFTRALLADVEALERLLAKGRFEAGQRRIGAEQEFFLVDEAWQPVRGALELLGDLGDPFTTELGLFNLEANLPPLALEGSCLAEMERCLSGLLERARAAAARRGWHLALCGILPTIGREHLGLDWMTPIDRYRQLNDAMSRLRGGEFRTLIKGLDELQATHDNVMFEACNTSFQIHLQVAPDEFARLYNVAQVITGPVLAAAVNSAVFLQKRLWHETRVALFQQSLDVRSEARAKRGGRQRVSFGTDWVRASVAEIFKEDVGRFRTLLAVEPEESSLEVLARGEIPRLRALCLHNGTVYRWNRPCYGVMDGVPHLRIENRVLPSGPTPLDEVANAAFFFGLMLALGDAEDDVTARMAFDDARGNFRAAARYGLHATFRWFDGRARPASELIRTELLPLARAGLLGRGVERADVERYLGVIDERVKADRTGAQWVLDSLGAMQGRGTANERSRALTRAMVEGAERGDPVHAWPLAAPVGEAEEHASFRTVGQIMTTDLFTLDPDDLVDLAASLMDWEHIRHVPVEDESGRLVGLITHRQLLRIVGRGLRGDGAPVAVRHIMRADPLTVAPDTSTRDAIALMRAERVGCLPVVEDGKLVGIVTQSDFIRVAAALLDRWLAAE